MQVFRLCNSAYASDLSGLGAALFPGRWNKAGTPVLYTSERPETALLEVLVNAPPLMLPELTLLSLEIPDDSILTLSASDLPEHWYQYPAPSVLADIGQNWIDEGRFLSLMVPSSVVHTAFNILINGHHPNINKLRLISQEPFYFDTRLRFMGKG